MEYNLYQYLEKNALKYPHNIAINYQKKHITYTDFLKKINLFVNYFSFTLKIKKGERIAVLIYNRINNLLSFLNLLRNIYSIKVIP